MNKRCTNSACRSTFSTLNFDGKCPLCGKAYPQLSSNRKQEPSPWKKQKPNSFLILHDHAYYRLKLKLGEVRRLAYQGQRLKAVMALRAELQNAGYKAEDLRDMLNYVLDIQSGQEDKNVWQLVTEADSCPRIIKMLRKE